MRVTSSALSLAVHAGVVVAAVIGTARGTPPPIRSHPPLHIPPLTRSSAPEQPPTLRVPNAPDGGGPLPRDLPTIVLDSVVRRTPGVSTSGPVLPTPPLPGLVEDVAVFDVGLVDDPPVLLAGPVPSYPELMRQAGVEGRVMLEAVVDTLGRVEAGSIEVVAATHPAFVASVRQTLAGALFRPGRVRGRAVRVRVRFPAQFMLSNNR